MPSWTGGEFASEYNGPREADGIVKYMRSQVGPASKQYNSPAELEQGLAKAKDVVVLGVFESESDSKYKSFIKAADRLRESVNFAHIFVKSASDVFSLAPLKDVGESSLPSVVLLRAAELKNKFENNFATWSSGELDEFVKQNYHGLVGHRTQNNLADFKVYLSICLLLFLNEF